MFALVMGCSVKVLPEDTESASGETATAGTSVTEGASAGGSATGGTSLTGGVTEPGASATDSPTAGGEEGPPCDHTTGDGYCDTCEPDLFFAEPYARVSGNFRGSCVLTGATDDPEGLDVALACDGEEFHVLVFETDVMPELVPLIDAVMDVDLQTSGDRAGAPRGDWVALRHDGQVVYASVSSGDALLPAGGGPGTYAPLTVAKWSGEACGQRATGQELDGDRLACEFAELTALEFSHDAEPPSVLQGVAGDYKPVPGGRLRVQVRRAIEGTSCGPDAPGPVELFTFSITFTAED